MRRVSTHAHTPEKHVQHDLRPMPRRAVYSDHGVITAPRVPSGHITKEGTPMKTLLIRAATLTLSLAALNGTPAQALCAAPPDLNGTWRANDGGTYHVRQIGTQVWWVGLSSDGGKSWTNVFHGTRSGNTVTGSWADTPRGAARSSGTLTLKLSGVNAVLGFKRTASTGGFGGSTWFMPCDDTVLNPSN